MKQQILGWWHSLQPRERQLLSVSAVILLLSGFYWLIWKPLHTASTSQQQALQQAQQQLVQLQQALPALRQAGVKTVRTGGSLQHIISDSARQHSIQVSRMQQQNEQLQLVLEDVSFEKLVQWLYQLQYQQGVSLLNLELSNTDKSGIVRVRRMVIE